MEINGLSHGQIHLWMKTMVIALGYVAVVCKKREKRLMVDRRATSVNLVFTLVCYCLV